MAIYYVNPAIGSNGNSGTSEDTPFASFWAVENLKLQPGDSVLLAAGSVFNDQLDLKYSGTVNAPITIGSYGVGDAPVIHSPNDGIHSLYASNIVIENIKISDTGGAAIYGGSVSNWTVRNVEVDHTGLAGKSGSVTFRTGSNITIENSTINDVNGDGVWIEKVNGVNFLNNTVTNAHGTAADAVQMNDSSNIVISGNYLDQTGAATPKGVIALVRPVNALVEDNAIIGGGFGIGAQAGTNVAIHDNDISGYGGYSWSYAIGLGDQGDTRDYDISGNYIHDGVWGVAVSAAGTTTYVREDIDIHNNVFDDLSQAALKVDRPASGSFHDNVIASDVTPYSISPAIIAANTFPVSNNTTLDEAQATLLASSDSLAVGDTTHTDTAPALVATHDSLKISSDLDAAHNGNILENDSSANGTLLLRRFEGEYVDKDGVTLTGQYGTIHVDSDGDYTYTADAAKLAGLSGDVSDTFHYKISDGTSLHFDTDTLSISIHVDDLLT
ncbi:right-handed parallel beta-helix repeat-containing protein [Rhizobium beringeri]|jgi:polysaccharidase protein|uniref:Right-handed parallel beta-helix repeat-containing protein n=2 Tax=Rhizobium TaxID=379 RepID=A0A444HN33_RHILE|nr:MULTISPECIES: right-handed parallel beta-helix repeat-containing protein [Rhizobium]MBY5457803.1 right-handed parallel beta-helix repeat-containing protein [Rhizobium leguminosarum]NKL65066.1 right-handed parallel beta-helix repeat-containing protein [Rhizobium leguminosarum bv. viciae]RWX18362.1 right-handed parallel beta-helix repeat-containing protein [Rhizobium leguminosarum]RWX23716.1 right-handed parallel beta-helix repeat-containing protein [Rhizobium leguminosarum]TAU53664.1 right-h